MAVGNGLCFASAAAVRAPQGARLRGGARFRACAAAGGDRKRVVVVGGGWGGLSAAHHLAKTGAVDVTLVEAARAVGGVVAGFEEGGKPTEIGVHGAWRPYRNLFALCDELGLDAFTDWTRSDSFSPLGRETSAPIFGDLPRLPAPLGPLAYTQFHRVGWADRLSALPLLAVLADFDPRRKEDWERYDRISARELLRTMGVSKELYRLVESMLLVGTFCPGEETSAAACLAFLYFFILAQQDAFDVRWPRGTSAEMIFNPLRARVESLGATIRTGARVSDYVEGPDGVTGVLLEGGEVVPADAVVSAVGISGFQGILRGSAVLGRHAKFRAVNKLRAIDVLAVRLYLDRRVVLDKPSNAAFGFDATTGWTIFDLNALHDRYRGAETSVVECDFYGAQQLTPMSDADAVLKVKGYIDRVIPAYKAAKVVDSTVVRAPRAVTHFSPGSHQHMLSGTSPIRNFFNAGDWIWTDHGSFSQERALVSGLQAANNVIDCLGVSAPRAEILPVPENEAHVDAARQLARRVRGAVGGRVPFAWM